MDHNSMIDRLKYVGNYQLDKVLGEGTFGKVKLGTHLLTGEKVAVKILDKERLVDPQDKERLSREIKIMKMLNNPYIIRLYEVIDTTKHMFLVLEYAPGGELFDYIVANERVKEKEARKFFRQLVSGLDYCHRKHVIHRDLKPENLLLDGNLNIKIVDFGFSNQTVSGQFLRTFCGSPAYAAPEMISGREYVGPEVDMWSLGVILFALLCGYLPFDNSNITRLYQLILRGEYKAPDFLSPESKHLISRLLTLSPEKRATLAEVRSHPWVNVGYYDLPECHPTTHDVIDPSIVKELETIGFDHEVIIKSLKDGERNQVTAAYWLLADKKRRATEKGPLANSSSQSLGSIPLTPSSPNSRRASGIPVPSPIDDGYAGSVTPKPMFFDRETPSPVTEKDRLVGRLPAIKEPRGTTSRTPKLGSISEDQPSSQTPASHGRRASQSQSNQGANGRAFRQTKDKQPATNRRRRHSVQPDLFSESLDLDSESTSVAGSIGNPLASSYPVNDRQTFINPLKISGDLPENEPVPTLPIGTSARRMSLNPQSLATIARKSQDKSELRELKGVFNVSTTSSKAGQSIMEEVKRVLDANYITYREKGFVLDCEDENNTRFEVEICRVQNAGNIGGVKLKRISGDVWIYKRLCQKLSSEFHL